MLPKNARNHLQFPKVKHPLHEGRSLACHSQRYLPGPLVSVHLGGGASPTFYQLVANLRGRPVYVIKMCGPGACVEQSSIVAGPGRDGAP